MHEIVDAILSAGFCIESLKEPRLWPYRDAVIIEARKP